MGTDQSRPKRYRPWLLLVFGVVVALAAGTASAAPQMLMGAVGSAARSSVPASGAPGNAERMNPPDAAAANPNCTLTVPPDPLSAQGLATPYRLSATNNRQGPCHESTVAQAAFVQAMVIDPNTGKLSVYNPLVVDQNKTPAEPPVVPALPGGAVVSIWFGFNGTKLTLRGDNNSLDQGNCVNGGRGSVFGQFAYCNAPAFFQAANNAIGAGKLAVPDPGTASDGKPCPTTRDFSVVDQDQSDNVTTTYLLINGTTAQNTAKNRSAHGNAFVLNNGSDNALLNAFIQPALGCNAFTAPDLANDGTPATALGLNELQAAAHQGNPVALVPPNDPMVLINNRQNTDKTNMYRAGVDMPPLNRNESPRNYCQNLMNNGANRIRNDRRFTLNAPAPVAAAGDPQQPNLFNFLQARFKTSLMMLKCQQKKKGGNNADQEPADGPDLDDPNVAPLKQHW